MAKAKTQILSTPVNESNEYTPPTLLNYTPVAIGPAETYRETMNENFANMKTNGDNISQSITDLNASISAVGKSGNASDLIPDTTHRLVTDAQITNWNDRLFLQEDTSTTPSTWKMYEGTTDVTAEVRTMFNSGVWKPENTSDLENTSGLLTTGDGFSTYKVIYLENQQTRRVSTNDTTIAGFPYKWEITLANATDSCTDAMTPTVVFNQNDSMSGNWAQVCQSGTGLVYVWSKSDVAATTVKAVYATEATNLQPVTS